MKILLATSSPHVLHNIKTTTGDAKIDIVETGEEVFQLLELNDYDCLITEINLMDIDVWSLARYVHSNIKQKSNKRLPIFVIEDKQVQYPKLLSSDYEIKTIDLSEPLDIDNLINNGSIDKPAVLVIDDDLSILDGMRIALKKEYEVDICHSGQEGLSCWIEKKHDLVLLDLLLPDITGEKVLQEIRSINPHQAIVIESARSEKESQQQLILLGANDYLAKPFTPEMLKKTCRVVLTQALYQCELNIREKKLNSIANELWVTLEVLENEESERAVDVINKIIHSMPDRIVNDDSCLNKAMERM
jgi:DNA-binding response OmpR family regulator